MKLETDIRNPPSTSGPSRAAAGESRLPVILAAYDEALRGAALPLQTDELSEELSSEEQAELKRAQVFLQLLEDVFPRSATSRSDSAASAGFRQPTSLGRFEIRRELGRGGFGVVYLAHDPKLEREVALKIPHPQLLCDPDAWSRFQREALAAAALDHPNIVAVHEAGEIEQTYYIALAYCPGVSLADWLRHQSDPVSEIAAAHLVATLARAAQYAHKRAIIHRDLKPANVLLTGDSPVTTHHSPLTACTARITDFGLAKNMEGGATQTQAGTMAGTPNYMAPEQAGDNGRLVGPATDVYALGAILYEVLTGRAPFQGHSALETLHQVRFSDPIAPSRLRNNLSRDLETICLKCLEKEPAKRYASAKALAEDLDRVLAGQPILARPVGGLERAYRWCRRKPMVAALLSALAVALIVGFAGIFWQWRRAEDNASRIKAESDKYFTEWTRAERHLTKARAVVERMAKLGTDLDRQPGFGKIGITVFEEALEFQLEVLREKPDDPAVRFEAAKAMRRVADTYFNLRQWDKAIPSFQRTLDLLAKLSDEFPKNDEYRFELGFAYARLGHVHRVSQKTPEAREAYDRAIAILDPVVAKHPKNAVYLTVLSEALHNSAIIAPTVEDRDRRNERSVALKEQALALEPDNPTYKRSLAFGLSAIASMHERHKRIDEAEAFYRKALKLDYEADAIDTNRPMQRYTGDGHRLLARLLLRHGQPQKAQQELEAALTIFHKLVRDFPDFPLFRKDLAETLFEVSKLVKAENPAKAKELFNEAESHFDRLAQEQATEPQSLRLQLAYFAVKGKELLSAKDHAAQVAYGKAVMAGERLMREFGPAGSDRRDLSGALLGLCNACELVKDWPKAEQSLRTWRDWSRRWSVEFPKNVGHAKDLAMSEDRLARVLERQARLDEALESGKSAVEVWRKVVALQKTLLNLRALADALLQQSHLLRKLQRDAEAIAVLREAIQPTPNHSPPFNQLAWLLATHPDVKLRSPLEAVDFAKRAVAEAPRDANTRNTLGVAYYRVGNYVAAIETLDEAIRLRRRGTALDWFFQAMARWQLDDKEAALQDYKQAVEWMEKRAPSDEELRRFRAEAELLLGISSKPTGCGPWVSR